ncbi:unnamed protein product [Rhizophagus irregularis]|uniref:ADP-ribosylation n=1 Tax=Rhizophagus irregularis TaxID=588596 RepID=A0A2I1GTQ3_9GLOM|nr:ADP-ribosylation [Rhizophagus irregularis]CAB4408715.1 unnamed protein product [Rhizophagus irregularis]
MGNCCSNSSNSNEDNGIQTKNIPPNLYSHTPPSPPLPPIPPVSQPQSQPLYNTPLPSDNSAYYKNPTYTNDNSSPLPGAINLLYSSDDDTQKEISIDQKSINDTVDNHCLNCSSNLVDKDLDGYPSEYCSDQCRKDASLAGLANPVCILCKEFPHVTGSKFCGKKRCRNLPKCYFCKIKDVHKGSLWCSKTCRDNTPNWQYLTVERTNYMCFVCGLEYALKGRDFCRDECEQWVNNNAPCLLKLPQNSEKYRDVHNQFVNAWKHPHKQVPSIHAIWKIYCNSLLNGQYNAYKAEVEKIQQLEGKPFPKGEGRRIMSAGNEQRRFHGTKLRCQIGFERSKVCDDKQCSVCAIIKEGYKLRYVGTGTISAAFQRFGSGIYFSGTSSKSDDYNEGSLITYMGVNYKMMLLNKVVVGKGYALTRDAMTLTSPPDGFDSVLGEPSSNGSLNYDEIVVYKEEASIPQYLIIYQTV